MDPFVVLAHEHRCGDKFALGIFDRLMQALLTASPNGPLVEDKDGADGWPCRAAKPSHQVAVATPGAWPIDA